MTASHFTTDSTPCKTCPKCKQAYPATFDWFYKDRRSKDGLSCYCRACKRAIAKRYIAANHERILEAKRIYRENNRQRLREDCRQYRRSHSKSELAKKSAAEWRNQRPGYAKIWAANNRDKTRAAAHRCRAKRISAEGYGTPFDEKAQLKAQRGKCYYCGCKLYDKYHIDHVIPLARGGSDYPENKVIACTKCNQRKGAKLPHEWGEGGRLL